jgi:Na+/H+ antiporter NhaC
VGLAFLTRDIYLALLLGAFGGSLLLHNGHPWLAFQDLLGERLLVALTNRWNISVLVFTLLMGGFVAVLNRNGGMAALSERLLRGKHDPRRAGLGAYFLGWLMFIDGLANAMLVGKTLRPAADRAGMSREKLAFIVDATSSPIAGLALISTWVAYEMSVIREGFVNTGDAALADSIAPFSWLLVSLPYRFYNWFILALVLVVIWTQRDWGPMWKAERNRRTESLRHEHVASRNDLVGSSVSLALIPIGILVIGVFVGLFVDGGGLTQPWSWTGLATALGKADAAGVFVLATAVAAVVALAFPWILRLLSELRRATRGEQTAGQSARRGSSPEMGVVSVSALGGVQAFMHGMQQMFLPALILVFAWLLNSVLKELGAAEYLVSWMGDSLPGGWLPVLVFVLSATVSFSTGTSWGTMAIVMPLAIPLAVSVAGLQVGGGMPPAVVGTIGAVLAGAVFGDHCSPISDTTIVSSFSCDCDVMAHVRTQLPYALTAGAIAVLLGYAPAGWGVPPILLLLLGGVACWATVRYVGKDQEPHRQPSNMRRHRDAP